MHIRLITDLHDGAELLLKRLIAQTRQRLIA